MSSLWYPNFWHWYCCCYCCCNPLNDFLDTLGDYCCCCCFIDPYEREDNSIEDDISLDAIVGESVIVFDFDSADDSLDDDEYYEIYPYKTRKDSENQLEVKLTKTVESIERARNLWNEKQNSMTKEDFYDIRDHYFRALVSSPEQFKRKIIKEYERFIDSYDYEKNYSYTIGSALGKARDTALDKVVRLEEYRYAIVNTTDLHNKKELKKEYNAFLRYNC